MTATRVDTPRRAGARLSADERAALGRTATTATTPALAEAARAGAIAVEV
jgi:hypothetical protein